MIYLDANATEPLRPEARLAVLAALELVGTPSSIHRAGRQARAVMEDAREAIAARFGARPADTVPPNRSARPCSKPSSAPFPTVPRSTSPWDSPASLHDAGVDIKNSLYQG